MFPQAVYFPIRTLYLTLKIEQREKHKSAEQALASKLQSAANQVRIYNFLWSFFSINNSQIDLSGIG